MVDQARSRHVVAVVVVVKEERAGRVGDKARILEAVVGDSSIADQVAAAAEAAGRDMLVVDSAGRRGGSMHVVVAIVIVADESATEHVPWTMHWRAEEVREASSRDL
jgi:hypothetical protein